MSKDIKFFLLTMAVSIVEIVLTAVIFLWAWTAFLADSLPDVPVTMSMILGVLIIRSLLFPAKIVKIEEEDKYERLRNACSRSLANILVPVIFIIVLSIFF